MVNNCSVQWRKENFQHLLLLSLIASVFCRFFLIFQLETYARMCGGIEKFDRHFQLYANVTVFSVISSQVQCTRAIRFNCHLGIDLYANTTSCLMIANKINSTTNCQFRRNIPKSICNCDKNKNKISTETLHTVHSHVTAVYDHFLFLLFYFFNTKTLSCSFQRNQIDLITELF